MPRWFKVPLPYIALVLAHVIWGGTPVVAKLTLNEFPIGTLAFLRFLLATILLLPFVWISRSQFKIKQSDLPGLVVVGLLIVTFNIYLFFMALEKTTAINTTVLGLSVPIFSVIVGWWVLRERIYWINLLGIGLGIAGALLIIGLPLIFLGSLTSGQLIGNLLMILSGLSFVAGAFLSKRLMLSYTPLVIVFSSFVVGSLSFLPLAVNDYLTGPSFISRLSLVGYFGLLYLAILSSICAYFLFTYGLKRVGLVKSDLVQYIQPAIAASLAIPLLGERISFSFIIGTCLVVLGVYWGTLGRPEHHHHHLRHHRV